MAPMPFCPGRTRRPSKNLLVAYDLKARGQALMHSIWYRILGNLTAARKFA